MIRGFSAMNFRQLETLIRVTDAGGFAGAAGRLHLSQPAASRQIQALEIELGVPLFDRVGRRLRPTTQGEEIVRHARRLLQDARFPAPESDVRLPVGLDGAVRPRQQSRPPIRCATAQTL
jgi:hypothetical protein